MLESIPVGTTYGTPTLTNSPVGSTQTITMQTSGSYVFSANTPGVYVYNVPYCVPGAVAPCPTQTLTITVLNPNVNNNPPVANPDIAVTKVNTAVVIQSLLNDKAGNPGGTLNPASVTVTVSALHGTTSIDLATGNNTYTPANNYTGWDELTYRVCDNNVAPLCATAKQYIFIQANNSPNTTFADDDYAFTQRNTSVTGNVKTNDTDPEGNTQTVTIQNSTVAAGTLNLQANGNFTFTPAANFTGPVNFVYQTCDNGNPQACANATLYILVSPPVTAFNPDFNVTYVNVPVPGNVRTNDVVPAGTTYGTSPALVSSPVGSAQTLNIASTGAYSFVANMPGVYVYDVPVCIPGAVAPCPTERLTITVLNPNVTNNPPVANPDIAVTKQNTAVLIQTLINDKAGNPGGSLNPGSVTVTVSALHGTSLIDAATGNNLYTPANGYTGWDELTYQVCDNNVAPLCATAKQYIYVVANNSVNTTFADDDYAYTPMNVSVSGNVKTNDTDPEGNTQTVTPQTNVIVAGGIFNLAANGNFTFTPTANFTGPVNFTYQTCDNGVPQACASATVYILVSPPVTAYNPDFNVTYVNVPVPGNVRTNDVVPAGTLYGTTPTLVSNPAGSTQTLTMNPNGSYTFTANTPGVYVYNVPVCVPGAVAPCPTESLTITVLNANTQNPPVANPDIAVTKMNTPVLIQSLANDKPGYPGASLNPGSVTVTVSALHGTTSIDAATGNNLYTPANGYTGWDELTYRVCDNSAPTLLCATAKQYIYVQANNSVNTTFADDDYAYTSINTAVSGNVKTNDTDLEGNTQTVTVQNSTVGAGTLQLSANGNFTFTPTAGFTGPVSFVYQTCDNGNPQACATATLYILVSPPAPLFNPDFNVTYVNVSVPGNVNTNDVVPAGTTYGTPVSVSGPAGATTTITMNPNGTYTFITNTKGVYVYNVPVCVPGQVAPCPTSSLTITVLDAALNNPPVANPDIAFTNMNQSVVINTLANDKAGYPGGSLNPASVTVTVNALHGTTSINPANGNNTYTPAVGYTGWDELTYQVCDNGTPVQCATAKQYIYVGTGNNNTTLADDDYVFTPMNTSVTGNVKTNDTDPQGQPQTVTPQVTPIAGKGTLTLLADGSFTFVPVAGFTGPVSYTYTTCDNGIPQACASATIYVLVSPSLPDYTVTNDIESLSFTNQNGERDFIVNVIELNNNPNIGQVQVLIRKISAFDITYNANATTANVFGVQPVNNSDWTFTETPNFIVATLKPGVTIPGHGTSSLGFHIARREGVAVNTTQNITSTIVAGSGGDSNNANNTAVTSVTAN